MDKQISTKYWKKNTGIKMAHGEIFAKEITEFKILERFAGDKRDYISCHKISIRRGK